MWHLMNALALKNKFAQASEIFDRNLLYEAENHLNITLALLVDAYNSGYCECFFETRFAHDLLKNIQTIKAEKLYHSFWPCEGMQKWADALHEIKLKESKK